MRGVNLLVPVALAVLGTFQGSLEAQTTGASAGSSGTKSMEKVKAADDRSGQVDELFAPWHKPDSPGAAVLVMKGDRVVHSRGYGMANLEHGVPIREHTVFDIASVSKQFGAFAVLLLEARGEIDLEDDIRDYIPEVPDFGHTITIEHLVYHTSGLRDWPMTLRMAGWDYEDVISFEQILRMTYAQEKLNFPPGTDYAYSNTGYNLLAELVQRVTGDSYRRWTDEHIFGPLEMEDTHFHDDHNEIVPNRAQSYHESEDGEYQRAVSSLTALSSSSLFTTVEDLARWIRNFDKTEVGRGRVILRMHETGELDEGEALDYGFGLRIDEYHGLKRVSHGGSWAGYRTTLQMFPDEDFAVVVLANTSDINAGGMGTDIAEIYLKHEMERPRVAEEEEEPPSPDDEPEWSPSARELDEYTGTYESPELTTGWTIAVEDDQLVAKHFRTGKHVLNPAREGEFTGRGFGTVRFERGEDGSVEAFTVNSARVRQLRFYQTEAR